MNPSQKPTSPAAAPEKRQSLRLDTLFPVWISSVEHGDSTAVARNVSAGGVFIETDDPLPLGAMVRVHFYLPSSAAASEIVACGEVKNHYFLNFADGAAGPRAIAGMGVRFLRFEDGGPESLLRGLSRFRVIH